VNSVGFNLLGAIGVDNGASFGLTSAPLYSEIASVATGNVFLAILILGGFIFWSYTWLPGQILNASRNLVAYSLDGIMPRQLSYVHPRFHTPVIAVWLVSIGSIVFLYLYIYTAVFATLTGIFGFILSFGLVSIAAILFPYRLKDVFESSPVRWRLAGVPVITIMGVLALISCIVSEVIFLKDPLAGFQQADGSPYWSRIIYNVAIFASGLVIYFVARAINRRRGVDIDRRFASIPVE
jgi:amino acid transporter